MLPHQEDLRQRVEAAKRETRSKQAHRLVDYLLVNEVALTGDIARDCQIGNVSCAACYIRPALQRRGLTIIARLPRPLIRNRFGEVSQSHEWLLRAIH